MLIDNQGRKSPSLIRDAFDRHTQLYPVHNSGHLLQFSCLSLSGLRLFFSIFAPFENRIIVGKNDFNNFYDLAIKSTAFRGKPTLFQSIRNKNEAITANCFNFVK